MEVFTAVRAWAEETFGSVDLGDQRRTQRLIECATQIAAHPEKPFNQVFDWNGVRAFYRLCHQETATLAALQAPHWQQTRQEMGKHPLVLILHDTTVLDYTDHTALQGVGPVGDGEGRGFLQHNSLAIIPEPRQVLGLAFQQLYIRKEAPKDEHTSKRKRRERESQLWMRGIEALGRPQPGCCWVDVGDRGADIYEATIASVTQGHHFVFRVTQNRQVWDTPECCPEFTKLRNHARGLASQGHDTVDILGRGGREGRQAEVELAAAPVWIPAPSGTLKRAAQPVVSAWVVRIWEATPPKGVEPLEWILITSVPTQTIQEIRQRRDWYACRWMVEVFHDIEKNGCSEEARRFETAQRMEACLAILSLVAVRIFQMRTALEVQPNAPAEQVASEQEIQVMRQYLKHTGPFTVSDFVRGVARLGGFLGRKSDGNPGVKTLWRGYQRLQDFLLGFQFRVTPGGKEVGNR